MFKPRENALLDFLPRETAFRILVVFFQTALQFLSLLVRNTQLHNVCK